MEGELFVDGQLPDFSVLQDLLSPPCLESEASSSSPGGPNPAGAGPEAAAPRGFRCEPLGAMACCLQLSDPSALSFLQETAQLLSPPEPIGRKPDRPAGRDARPRRSARASPGAALEPLDALSLISLHCASLGAKPTDRGERAEAGAAARETIPGALAKGLPARRLRALGAEAQRGTDAFPASESPRAGRRVSRKQPRPQRSCEARDPDFQGVTFRMQLSFCRKSSGGCRLLIRPRYSSGKLGKRSRTPLAREECRAGSSKEEEGCPSTHRDKCCASCKTKKTPLWRDAEDGTPLCNACGIRYLMTAEIAWRISCWFP
ncbi:GATA-type zinc finger protein 1 isoform X2 [Lacerta agilis]|uniref:GATA-type zinc finger protein 1 isoform X2 n=1 Tax=Lacerta agilis TaxID=80427 RepID=UPI00141A449A|nr:GATA-type zinc finger protein 1 isoform X2 [Lacerta agilis]